MDLFTAVAERMQEASPEIRPVVATPYEVADQGDGFEIESRETEAPAVRRQSMEPVEAPYSQNETSETVEQSQRIDSRETVSPTENAPPALSVPILTSPLEPEMMLPAEKPAVQDSQISPTPEFKIPESQEPIERVIHVHEERASESPLTNVREPLAPNLEVAKESQTTVVQNELVSNIQSTTVKNQSFSVRHVQIDASTVANESITTIHQEAPHIVIPANPIEVAIHSPVHNTQIVQEIGKAGQSEPAPDSRVNESKTVVDIRIGRIEVNAIKGPPAGRRPVATNQPNSRLSLDDVLKKRGRS